MRMPDGMDITLFGLGAIYQVFRDGQARSRVSGAQAGLTITEYLVQSSQPNKDIIWWTWNQQSVQESIKRLIREEMRKTGKTPPAWL